MAADVLDVVPEYPQIEHVAGEAQEAAVQKHRREQGDARRHYGEVRRQRRSVNSTAGRNKAVDDAGSSARSE